MQEWNSRKIRSAVLHGVSDDPSINKLKTLLAEVRKSFPVAIRSQLLYTLCYIEKLSIYVPRDVEGVWIVAGNFKQAAGLAAITIEAEGYSNAESIVGLINKIAINRALLALNETSAAVSSRSTSYPALHNYSQSLLAMLLAPVSASNDMWPVRHLANRVDSVFPKKLYFQPIPGVLPDITEGCAASVRQRDAIAIALCRKIEIHAFALWRYRQFPPRYLSRELQVIFEYYSKRCLRKKVLSREFLLDISLDWGPTVYVAVSINNDNGSIVAGTGSGISAHVGIARAVLDLRWKECFLQQILLKKLVLSPMNLDSREQGVLHDIQTDNEPFKQLTKPGREMIKEKFWPERTFVRRVARQAESVGIDLFYSDVTTAGSPLSVVKVLSPQLLTSATVNLTVGQ